MNEIRTLRYKEIRRPLKGEWLSSVQAGVYPFQIQGKGDVLSPRRMRIAWGWGNIKYWTSFLFFPFTSSPPVPFASRLSISISYFSSYCLLCFLLLLHFSSFILSPPSSVSYCHFLLFLFLLLHLLLLIFTLLHLSSSSFVFVQFSYSSSPFLYFLLLRPLTDLFLNLSNFAFMYSSRFFLSYMSGFLLLLLLSLLPSSLCSFLLFFFGSSASF